MRVVRVVDLSVRLTPGMPVYPGDPAPSFRPHARLAGDGYNLLRLALGSQTGTHVDAPRHVDDPAATVEQLDLGLFTGRGVLLDVPGLADREPIGPERWDLTGLGPGDVALLRAGWSQHWGTPRYDQHPFLTADAAEAVLSTGVRTLLLDVASPDAPTGDLVVHRAFAAAGGVIGENLVLDGIDFLDPLICCFPLRLVGGGPDGTDVVDGSPVRAVALQLAP